ncbi:hypothetical protein IWZ01DRAFT_558052, partial [Phyllosticta capitalensis]
HCPWDDRHRTFCDLASPQSTHLPALDTSSGIDKASTTDWPSHHFLLKGKMPHARKNQVTQLTRIATVPPFKNRVCRFLQHPDPVLFHVSMQRTIVECWTSRTGSPVDTGSILLAVAHGNRITSHVTDSVHAQPPARFQSLHNLRAWCEVGTFFQIGIGIGVSGVITITSQPIPFMSSRPVLPGLR